MSGSTCNRCKHTLVSGEPSCGTKKVFNVVTCGNCATRHWQCGDCGLINFKSRKTLAQHKLNTCTVNRGPMPPCVCDCGMEIVFSQTVGIQTGSSEHETSTCCFCEVPFYRCTICYKRHFKDDLKNLRSHQQSCQKKRLTGHHHKGVTMSMATSTAIPTDYTTAAETLMQMKETASVQSSDEQTQIQPEGTTENDNNNNNMDFSDMNERSQIYFCQQHNATIDDAGRRGIVARALEHSKGTDTVNGKIESGDRAKYATIGVKQHCFSP